MPRVSERQFMLGKLDHMIKTMAMCDEDEKEIDEMLDLRASLSFCRYLDLRRHIRKNKSMNEMLWFYDDREFKQVVRMKKDSFLKLLNLISDDEAFGDIDKRLFGYNFRLFSSDLDAMEMEPQLVDCRGLLDFL